LAAISSGGRNPCSLYGKSVDEPLDMIQESIDQIQPVRRRLEFHPPDDFVENACGIECADRPNVFVAHG
jgi:hypothetical protein